MRRSSLIFCFLLFGFVTSTSNADNLVWSGWLGGPSRNGYVRGFQPPKSWPKKLIKDWELNVGTGYASPALDGQGNVFVHARQKNTEVVMRIELKSGDIKWRKQYATKFKPGGGGEYHGIGPKACPSIGSGRVYTMSIAGVLSAWDCETGKRLWARSYGKQFKKPTKHWGSTGSPLIDGERVVSHFGTDGKGFLRCFDGASGDVVWTQGKTGPSYSSAMLAVIDGQRQIIEWNEKDLVGIDGKSGKRLWKFHAPGTMLDQNMPTPTFHNGTILLGAENRGMKCVVPTRKNGVWTAKEKWFQKKIALDMSSAVINNGKLYGMSHYSKGRLFCLDPKTGKILWMGPPRVGSNVTFLSIPGYVIALTDRGLLQVIAADATKYRKVAEYRVAPAHTWTPPVLVKGGVLIKGKSKLTLWRF